MKSWHFLFLDTDPSMAALDSQKPSYTYVWYKSLITCTFDSQENFIRVFSLNHTSWVKLKPSNYNSNWVVKGLFHIVFFPILKNDMKEPFKNSKSDSEHLSSHRNWVPTPKCWGLSQAWSSLNQMKVLNSQTVSTW